MTAPPDLPTFLLARFAEDEAWARAADAAPWHYEPLPAWERFLDRWQPDTVLAEVAAKRRIVTSAQQTKAIDPSRRGDYWQGTADRDTAHLCLLALPYADHPDYRQEWTP